MDNLFVFLCVFNSHSHRLAAGKKEERKKES